MTISPATVLRALFLPLMWSKGRAAFSPSSSSSSASTLRSVYTQLMSTNDVDVLSEDGKDLSLSVGKKVHHVTVCMVPPPEADFVWKTVGDMRRQLKDPGFYRWPPHVNLLYPFLETTDQDVTIDDLVTTLQLAASRIEPFTVRLDRLATFGGKHRGVLWLAPDSFRTSGDQSRGEEEEEDVKPPLFMLHQALEDAFPMCRDGGSSFTPHMTLSHFANLDDAMVAQQAIQNDYADHLPKLHFWLDRIYLLRRTGDSGQFLRLAEIGLGKSGTAMPQLQHYWQVEPCPFPGMPTEEADWVYEERMKLKERRNGGQRGRRGGRGYQNYRSSTTRASRRVPDTPEAIAAKRAERQAKRERLEREKQLRDSADESSIG